MLASPAVEERIDAGCGPVTTPTHKIVPDVRWLLDADSDEVISRSDPELPPVIAGELAIGQGRRTLDKQAFDGDTAATTQASPGWPRADRARRRTTPSGRRVE